MSLRLSGNGSNHSEALVYVGVEEAMCIHQTAIQTHEVDSIYDNNESVSYPSMSFHSKRMLLW
jgi:hypothetical protein